MLGIVVRGHLADPLEKNQQMGTTRQILTARNVEGRQADQPEKYVLDAHGGIPCCSPAHLQLLLQPCVVQRKRGHASDDIKGEGGTCVMRGGARTSSFRLPRKQCLNHASCSVRCWWAA